MPGRTFHAVGLNHQTAPVSLRERVAFDDAALPAALAALRALPGVQEVVLLSTCNRTELYAVTDGNSEMLADWLATHPHDSTERAASAGQGLRDYFYRHRGVDAVQHLFRVAAGLDS
ncbi:MAG: hypothetical protein ABIO38_06190, partial [Luteimonas sp.]